MHTFANPVTNRIVQFLRSIGIPMQVEAIDGTTVLPGIQINAGGLVIDEFKLLYPGDLLHEAGHLAVLTTNERTAANGNLPSEGGHEMAAIAWSYAAALHIGISPEIVFHQQGYRQGSNTLLDNFRAGRYIAVPLLQWMGLAFDPTKAAEQGLKPFPHMLRWLRE